jgi:hypothetical protein
MAMLVHEAKEPGTHTVRFDWSGLSSGAYFYRLMAGSVVETHTLLLFR